LFFYNKINITILYS